MPHDFQCGLSGLRPGGWILEGGEDRQGIGAGVEAITTAVGVTLHAVVTVVVDFAMFGVHLCVVVARRARVGAGISARMAFVAITIRTTMIQRELVLEIRVPVIGTVTLTALTWEVIGGPRVARLAIG